MTRQAHYSDINSRGKKIYVHGKSVYKMFIASIYFTTTKNEATHVLQFVDGGQMVNIHTMHHYSATRGTNYCQIQAGWTTSALS